MRNRKKDPLKAVGIALLVAALAGLAAAIWLNAIGKYPLGANSWIAALALGVLLIAGAALSFRNAYARMSFSRKTGLWGILFLLPWLLGFTLFFLVPLLQAFRFSFEDVSINPTGGLNEVFVRLDNFRYILLEHPTFVRDVAETVLEVVLYTALIIVFSLLCAILLNGKFFGRSLARGIFFIPIVMATGLMIERVSNTAGILMAQSQEQSVYGAAIVSKLLFSLGVGNGAISYLESAVNDIFNVVSLSGIQILIFLAALQGIPTQLYEVAKIEGATGYETFWKVTVVMVSPMMLTCTLYTISDLFLRSDLADTFKDIAFRQGRFGQSAAMSTSFLLVVVLVLAAYILPLRKAVFYYD